jgi:hypothetical protein
LSLKTNCFNFVLHKLPLFVFRKNNLQKKNSGGLCPYKHTAFGTNATRGQSFDEMQVEVSGD